MNKLILFSFFIILYCNTKAQVNWQRINVPNESVSSLSANSSNDVYAGTFTYGVFKSIDEGSNWVNISLGLADSGITALQFSSDNKLFAGTSSHGVFLYNAGSWSAINNGLPVTNIYVTAFAKGAAGNMYMMANTGSIYLWNGTIWSDITNNFPTLGRAIAVGPTGILYAGAFASGVYKFDGINNWTIVGGAMSNNFVTKMTVGINDTIYVACNSNNVFRCPAAGGSWTLINIGLPAVNVNFIGTDASNRVIIGNNSTYGTVYRSLNNGDSWSLVSANIYTTTVSSYCTSTSGKIYIGASGVFKSSDGGGTWADMNPGMNAPKSTLSFLCTKTGTFFVGTRYGPWRSTDNGNTWQLRNTNITHLSDFQIMENAAGEILLHGFNSTPKGAIYRSVNNGDTWTQVAANGCDMYTRLKQHKSDTIWASSRFSGATTLSYSINNGATWVNNPLTISAIWDIEFNNESTIFIGSESEGVSRSDNGGQTFTLGVGNTIPWYGNVIAIETDANGVIFVGGDWWTHTMWFSSPAENGNNWTEFTDPDLVVSGIQDIVFDQHNNVYLACENNGVRMAYNSNWNPGTNWINSSVGLPAQNINVLALCFDTSGYIYSTCYTGNGHAGGIYKSTVPVNPPNSSIFSFTGNGNWNTASNWKNNNMPPAVLSGNAIINIDPPLNGECVLNVQQQITNGVIFRVMPNKKLRITGNLQLQ